MTADTDRKAEQAEARRLRRLARSRAVAPVPAPPTADAQPDAQTPSDLGAALAALAHHYRKDYDR